MKITNFRMNECIRNYIPMALELIDITKIDELPNTYPDEFNEFCISNGLKPPSITTGNGKALSAMLSYKEYYWNRTTCDAFVEKFNIPTKDSIQLFNKHNQWGIQTNSGIERGRLRRQFLKETERRRERRQIYQEPFHSFCNHKPFVLRGKGMEGED